MNSHPLYRDRCPVVRLSTGEPVVWAWTFRGWMQAMQTALIGYTCRATLAHVSVETWRAHYEAGDAPADAVLAELVRVAE